MAEAQPKRGGLPRPILWLLVLGLLGAVWWLASERNQRRFVWSADGGTLVISKGGFFPIGARSIASDDPKYGKIYGPLKIPEGAKVGDQEFDDQTALDRALFDLVVPWAKADAQKGDEPSITRANAMLDRTSALPGLTAEQHQALGAARGDLSFTAARQELLQAAKLVLSARRKLEAVREGGGDHALEALPMLQGLEGIQGLLEDSAQGKDRLGRAAATAATPSSNPAPASTRSPSSTSKPTPTSNPGSTQESSGKPAAPAAAKPDRAGTDQR